MEEKNEILAAMRDGFARVDEQFLKLRSEFSDQLDGVSDGLHLELKAQFSRVLARVGAIGVDVDKIDSKIGLFGENVANVMTQLARYNENVEAPLEMRVTKLEGRVLVLEQKK